MEKGVKITFIVCATLLIIAVLGYFAFFSFRTGTTLSSDGTATVKAVPDLTTLFINIETNSTSAEAANNKNDEIYNKLVVELKKMGIEENELKTESYSNYPEYDWNDGQKFKGYKISHILKIEINSSKVTLSGKIIDATIRAGALINYINFELSPELQDIYRAEALKQAAENARAKAEVVASASGKTLGKIVSISMSSFDYYPWPMYTRAEGVAMDSAAIKSSASIQPGEKDVSASVNVIWELK